MKTKTRTYILLFLTLVVWGVIGWKIVNREQAEYNPPVSEKTPPARVKNPRDSLWLNYRDPFLGNIQRIGAVALTEEDNELEIPVPTPLFNVKCYGKIKKNRVDNYILEIEGEQFILKRGDTGNGYRLIEAYGEDSLKLSRDGHSFTIPFAI